MGDDPKHDRSRTPHWLLRVWLPIRWLRRLRRLRAVPCDHFLFIRLRLPIRWIWWIWWIWRIWRIWPIWLRLPILVIVCVDALKETLESRTIYSKMGSFSGRYFGVCENCVCDSTTAYMA